MTIDTATMTVHIRAADQIQGMVEVEPNHTVEVRPYARQDDEDVLRNIRPVHFLLGNTTTSLPPPPACQHNHEVPAVIFSSGGFTGNLFHEFNEIIIPLFLTTYHFQSRVQFILMDYKPIFANKYKRVMSRLSSYQIMDPAANPSVHCFSGAVAGLKWHDHLTLNPSDIPGRYTMDNFRHFLRQAYSLKIINVSEIKRPKLLLLSRRGTRRFVNEAQMVGMMRDLGFDVVVATKPNRMSNLNKFSRVVNSCSVLLGSHGAGLANELFLPDGGVMVQIDLLGLEWGSAHFYGNPAEAMRLHYLRYKIEPEESTLSDIYGRNHTVITDPDSIFAKGYQAGRAVYLDQQNVKLNLVRLRETLVEALRLTGFSTPQKQ